MDPLDTFLMIVDQLLQNLEIHFNIMIEIYDHTISIHSNKFQLFELSQFL